MEQFNNLLMPLTIVNYVDHYAGDVQVHLPSVFLAIQLKIEFYRAISVYVMSMEVHMMIIRAIYALYVMLHVKHVLGEERPTV